MIPEAAVEAAAKWLHNNNCRSALHSGFPADFECYDWLDEAKELLEAAAPHMERGDGENRPGWDDRKKLSSIWQERAPLPPEGLSERVYEALIEVAAWGYQQRIEEEA